MDALPVEIVAHIFGFIPTKELYPGCFLINSFCLSAALNEIQWKIRCSDELDVEEALPNLSWKETYKGIETTK